MTAAGWHWYATQTTAKYEIERRIIRLRIVFSIRFVVILVTLLGLVSTPIANTHRSCEAATLTITATGKIPGYELTISSTFGGSVYAIFHQEEMAIGPNETESISDVPTGTVVNLIAEPQESYCFANWTGDVHTIANTNVGQTTITVDDHYSITASFRELPPQPRNWALVGGIAAGAAAVVGLVIFVMRRKRAVDGGRALN